ncbi:hypothetical protein Cme02nite_38540 [Catellatospora methionotrophica]|uniref:Uncharacterized protein n=1 Tax=Catellatospora methionotrophica TaxID=121620 RepID=A0A8J3L6Y6_9ACTN|nr:hypothetical protein [Catellatospora methionotrophica]GIG15522.1 hypothetical protein Cme02nite_38540 [Catellatospora methionotrophica]
MNDQYAIHCGNPEHRSYGPAATYATRAEAERYLPYASPCMRVMTRTDRSWTPVEAREVTA